MRWAKNRIGEHVAIRVVVVGVLAAGMAAVPTPAHAAEWWEKWAPNVYLYPSEPWDPMSASTSVERSTLSWAHDGVCSDELKASDPTETQLAGPNFDERQKGATCGDYGDTYDSNDDAAVYDDGGPGEPEEGFYLDLADGYRDGQGFGGNEPVYIRYSSGNWIQYWFHHGYSETNIPGPVNVGHESDWEHISIKLNDSNVPQKVEYSIHHEKCTLSWANAPKTSGGRPRIMSAWGSHGSYPVGMEPWYYDAVSTNGNLWNTSTNPDRVYDRNWWGYGGAWGDVGTTNNTSGPQGPHVSRAAPSFTAANCW